jgi:leucyl aminopeptidase (aminopeptidase T)
MLAVEATLATPERAKAQGLNYERWREVMFRGCTVDHKELARRSKLLATLMSGKRSVSITTDLGTNLRLALDHRPVDISDGIATEEKAEKGRITFLPAGAIEVSVDEGSVDGRIIYDAPVRLGDEIIAHLDVNLSEGLVKRYNATRGAKAFGQYLGSGGSDAGRFAFLGFGLNPYLRYGCLQDDKVLGGVTLGFGSNESMGGRNVATEQWWASIMNATVSIDGMMVMDKGKLLV